MTLARTVAAAALGYGAGTLASAEIVARRIDPSLDPTRRGSGNPGAANVGGLAGWGAGAAVFGLDVGKAVAAGRVGALLAGAAGANAAAAGAVWGHCFPAQRGFRGGKGVATSFGQMLATFPAYLPVDLALGAAAARSDRWKSRPTATAAATCGLWTALAWLWWGRGWPNAWAGPATAATPIAAAVSSAAIITRFRQAAHDGP